MRFLCNGIYVNKKQMKSFEKSITFAFSWKVAVGKVKCIFIINILVNYTQNNINAVGETFWRSLFQFLKVVRRCSERSILIISWISPCNFIEKDGSTDVFLWVLRYFWEHLFLRNLRTAACESLLREFNNLLFPCLGTVPIIFNV